MRSSRRRPITATSTTRSFPGLDPRLLLLLLLLLTLAPSPSPVVRAFHYYLAEAKYCHLALEPGVRIMGKPVEPSPLPSPIVV